MGHVFCHRMVENLLAETRDGRSGVVSSLILPHVGGFMLGAVVLK